MPRLKSLLTFQVHIIEADSQHHYGKTCIQVMDCDKIPLSDRLVKCYRNPKGYGPADRYLSFIANDHDYIFEPIISPINLCLDWQHYDGGSDPYCNDSSESSYCSHKVEGNESYELMKRHMKLLDRMVKKGAILNDPASVVETLISLGAVHVERVEYNKYQSELVRAMSAPVFRTSLKEVV